MKKKLPPREAAASRFMLRVGQAGEVSDRLNDYVSGWLWPIAEFMRCDGTLASDAARVLEART